MIILQFDHVAVFLLHWLPVYVLPHCPHLFSSTLIINTSSNLIAQTSLNRYLRMPREFPALVECGNQHVLEKHSHPATIYQRERGLQQFNSICQQ
jgi:hypothetical protein